MQWKPLLLSVSCAAALLADVDPAGAQTTAACTEDNTVFAHVVALDQPIANNRLGATIPGGMIFALARDVCALADGQQSCSGQAPTAGNVIVKPYKRPRPMTLRVNQGQCLQIGFTNLLSSASQGNTTTRAASVHVQGLELADTIQSDGSWVGNNPTGLVGPATNPLSIAQPQITYTLYAAQEGAFLLYSTGDTFSAVGADGGQLAFGLFGAVHVEPAEAEWYRSQVTADDLVAASQPKLSTYGQPLINYQAVYTNTTSDSCFQQGTCRVGPVLDMSCGEAANPAYLCYHPNEIVHSDLTALITGPDAGRFPAERPETPEMRSSYSLPDRLQPFREFTIIYHESFSVQQAFQAFYAASATAGNGEDNFGINYGMGGIGSEVIANRIGVGPMSNCTSCKFEEFFLASWAVGDPAMIVDHPASSNCTFNGAVADCTKQPVATQAFFPDDPSNVYHSYISDHTKFRILHGGSDLHHVHHQHAHQWLHSPDTSNGDYLDSQSIGPGSSFSLEMVFGGSGNINQTVGDSIFHCHFYPHFAAGMWSLWRVHDVYETGTVLQDDGKPATGVNRALPDGEIAAGTPIPALVPLPTIPMPPMPGKVRLAADGTRVEICDAQGGSCISALDARAQDPAKYQNPGFPFFIPGIGGQRAPHPPMDFAKGDDGALLDGGLPRHLIQACAAGPNGCSDIASLSDYTDFSKTLTKVQAIELPEDGTFAEKLAMKFHAQRLVDSVTPENQDLTHNAYQHPPAERKAQFILNGLPPIAGAPFADPCVEYDLDGGRPKWHSVRQYKAADIQLDVTFNKEGWHFPQQRMLSLWGDVQSYLSGEKPPEPFFFRANSGDCIEYVLANLVPNVYELDDFQVRTPTDILGQHIHLVKFDVTSSDGATNGFNYEDGTLSPNEVTERIVAINAGGGLTGVNGGKRQLKAKTLPFFGPGPGGRWMGAQATVQRWYTDRLFDGTIQKPGVDRTLRTVFTHDHFGPSTHQQAGLYAGLVIEPFESSWFHNESGPDAPPFGGVEKDGKRVPPRTVSGYDGRTVQDGGPTTWQAVIVPVREPGSSFREFLLEFQDTTLTYEQFSDQITAPSLGQGFCSDNGASCRPATARNRKAGTERCKNPATAVCYMYGFCSTNPQVACKPATATAPEDVSACPAATTAGVEPTCNLIPGIPSSNSNTQVPVYAWSTTPLDNQGVELITLAGGTNSFSVNYRNEPLFMRIDQSQGASQGQPASGQAGDLSYAYASIPRPNLPCAFPKDPLCSPYKPLTAGVGANDPFTPLLRAYPGDDVQIRTLVGAHINPHNFTVHGVKWLEEPSFVDSGWRNSEVMGISEHFEEIFKLPSVAGAGDSDYLYMPGAAAIEQAGGSWGLLRAYANPQNNLRPLHQNRKPAAAPVCPPNLPPSQQRSYTVVALTAGQALKDSGGALIYNSRGEMADPKAILYFQIEDLNCPDNKPSGLCRSKSARPDPLVLRANAGDCMTVTLYNMINPKEVPLGAGAAAPVTPTSCGTSSSASCASSTSDKVGLHPQLVSFDVTASNGFNAGNNPDQAVEPTQSRTYTWYAGNVDPAAPAGQQHIPIEFGAANLLPADTINHHQYGLFGALVIEPGGSSCVVDGKERAIETCRRAQATIRHGGQSFKEFVLITQDGLQGPNGLTTPLTLQTAWLTGDHLNAVNYRSEMLYLPLKVGGPFRSCPGLPSGDVSCVLSNTAQCCASATGGACNSWVTCGEPQTPIFEACAGEQVRFRVLHPGGINTNQVFELHGHAWQEQPYMSSGKGCAKPAPTTQANLYASSQIGTENGCDPLEQDTYSEYQGSRMGHGPTNHFDVLIPSAGGTHKVPGDYLYRTYPADHFRLGLWGIFRVKDKEDASCKPSQIAVTGTAPGGEGR